MHRRVCAETGTSVCQSGARDHLSICRPPARCRMGTGDGARWVLAEPGREDLAPGAVSGRSPQVGCRSPARPLRAGGMMERVCLRCSELLAKEDLKPPYRSLLPRMTALTYEPSDP